MMHAMHTTHITQPGNAHNASPYIVGDASVAQGCTDRREPGTLLRRMVWGRRGKICCSWRGRLAVGQRIVTEFGPAAIWAPFGNYSALLHSPDALQNRTSFWASRPSSSSAVLCKEHARRAFGTGQQTRQRGPGEPGSGRILSGTSASAILAEPHPLTLIYLQPSLPLHSIRTAHLARLERCARALSRRPSLVTSRFRCALLPPAPRFRSSPGFPRIPQTLF
jgi:hypothetical protein